MSLYIHELRKLWRIFLADPKPLAAGVIAPSLILICFALVFGNFSSLPLAIVNQDSGAEGALLETEILTQISPLGNAPYFSKSGDTIEVAEREMQEGKVMGILVIPEDFTRRIQAGDAPAIRFALRNYNTDIAKNMRLYLAEGIWSFYLDRYPDVRVELTESEASGPQVQWVLIIASGSIVLAFILGGMFTYVYLFFKEKLKGTIWLYALGTGPLLGSFAARVTIALGVALLSGTVNGLIAYLLTGSSVFGSVLLVFPALMLTAVVYICFAAIFTLIINDFYAANLASMFGSILIWFLTGGMHGGRSTDPVLGALAAAMPNTYAQDIVSFALFGMHYDPPWFNYVIVAAMAICALAAAGLMYRHRLRPT